jgi:sphinganine C4-monooxygenase
MATIGFVSPQNLSSVLSRTTAPPEYVVVKRPDLIAGIPDGLLALVSPIIAYWTYATFFHVIDVYQLAEKYRIHPSAEEESRNKVTLQEVLRDVILQHVVQTIVGWGVYKLDPVPTTGFEIYEMWWLRQKYAPAFVSDTVLWWAYTYGFSLIRIVLAFCFIDTWQYTLHRIMHVNKWLYRRFHSRHHRLYVPYAYGALYNDPVEGFLLDTAGTGLASIVFGLTPRENICLYTFATMKTVDDHCGYRLPFDFFQWAFPNNSIYHDIHHQIWGIKSNFSQPFFTFWDRLFGTRYEFVNEYKTMQDHITLTKYREFLQAKEAKKRAAKQKKET